MSIGATCSARFAGPAWEEARLGISKFACQTIENINWTAINIPDRLRKEVIKIFRHPPCLRDVPLNNFCFTKGTPRRLRPECVQAPADFKYQSVERIRIIWNKDYLSQAKSAACGNAFGILNGA